MGKKTPLTEEQKERAEKAIPIVKYLLRPWCRLYPHLAEELYGMAMMDLVLIARTYRPGQCAFASVVGFRIGRRIKRNLRKIFRTEARYQTNCIQYPDHRSADDATARADAQEDAHILLNTLPLKDRLLVTRVCMEGLPIRRAAAGLCWRRTAKQRVEVALEHMKTSVEKE